MKKVLLAMDEGMAGQLRTIFEDNSQALKVLPQSVPFFRSIKPSLIRFKPDILFIAMYRLKYDHPDKIKDELAKCIYDIKTDQQFSNVRIALQTNLPADDPFLKKVASYQVYDIFTPAGNGGNIDMLAVISQLSKPANMKNVERYLSIEAPVEYHSVTKAKSHTAKYDKEKVADKPEVKEEKTKDTKPADKLKPKTKQIVQKSTPPAKEIKTPVIEENAKNHDDNGAGDIKKKKLKKIKAHKRKPKEHKVKISRPHKPKNKGKLSSSHWKPKLLIALLIVCILFVGGFAISRMSKGTVNTTPYSSLISQKKYVEAASTYPSKAVSAENAMLADSSIKNKSDYTDSIADSSSADPIRFDDAYFNGDFDKVVDIYENSNSEDLIHLNRARRTMLAYSYMKTNDIEDAKEIAKPLNNQQLNQKIDAYSQFLKSNSVLKRKIKNGNLSDADKHKAEIEIKKNKRAMEEL